MFNIFTTGLGIEDRNAVIKYVGDTNLDNYQYRGGKRYPLSYDMLIL